MDRMFAQLNIAHYREKLELAFQSRLRCFPMIYYLATPYAGFPGGINLAHSSTCNLAGRLIVKGYRIYSPIVHCHTISMAATIRIDNEAWIAYNYEMMEVCDALMVGMLPSWKQGITYEIDRFERDKKPIFFVNPGNLRIKARKRA